MITLIKEENKWEDTNEMEFYLILGGRPVHK